MCPGFPPFSPSTLPWLWEDTVFTPVYADVCVLLSNETGAKFLVLDLYWDTLYNNWKVCCSVPVITLWVWERRQLYCLAFFFLFSFFLLLSSSKTNSQTLFEFEFSAASVAKDTQGEMIGEINYDISTFIKITTASYKSPLTQWPFCNQELLVPDAAMALGMIPSLLFSVWKQGEVQRS